MEHTERAVLPEVCRSDTKNGRTEWRRFFDLPHPEATSKRSGFPFHRSPGYCLGMLPVPTQKTGRHPIVLRYPEGNGMHPLRHSCFGRGLGFFLAIRSILCWSVLVEGACSTQL